MGTFIFLATILASFGLKDVHTKQGYKIGLKQTLDITDPSAYYLQTENKRAKCKRIFREFIGQISQELSIAVALLSSFCTLMCYICILQYGTLIFKQAYTDD